MSVAERFANSESIPILKTTQMIALLSLPDAEETEKFIEAKAAEGKQVADMTIKQLRAGCKFYPVVDDERARRRQRGFSHGAEKIPNAKNLITQRTGAREKVSDKERDNRRPYFLLRKCQKCQ